MISEKQTPTADTAGQKRTLRAQLLARRMRLDRQLDETAKAGFLHRLEAAVARGQIDEKALKEVAGYIPMRGEADPDALLQWLAKAGAALSLPVVAKKNEAMVFRRHEQGKPLDSGAYGTQHPDENQPVIMPSLIIVPLVAFDLRGYRIGYGGGYYDRTLESFGKAGHKVVTMGLAYAGQQVEAVPVEPHDRPLDMVLTEQSLHFFNSRG